MKQTILILILLCASTLNCLQPTTKELEIYKSLAALPELQKEIIAAALATTKNLDEAIHMIEKLSILRGIRYDNLKNFTALMNILAKKFPDITRQEIAQKFTLPIAKEYIELNNLFIHNVSRIKYYRPEKSGNALHEVTKLLDDIDPNYSRISPNSSTDKQMQETVLQITFDNYANVFSKGYTFLNHPHLILIMAALIHKGAKVDAELIKKAEQEANENPTDSNINLLKILTHANT
jgi:hypothetical protein